MLINVPDEIDCALLFGQFYPPIDVAPVIHFLNSAFPGAEFRLAAGGQEESFFVLSGNGPLFVLVSQNRRPLPPEGFRQALHSPFQQILAPHIDQAVAEHTGNVSITVSHKLPPGDLVTPALKVSKQPAPLVERKIRICQVLANHLTAPLEASAVHWCQSNLLLTPELLRTAAADAHFPSPIIIHPQLFSSGEPVGGRHSVGFKTFGARFVIGHEILFTEAPADLRWMIERTLNFLQMAHINGYRLIPDGESFGATADEVIRVRYRPPDGDDVPLIELTVEKSPAAAHRHCAAPSGISTATAQTLAPPEPGRPVFGKRKPL